MLCSKACGYAVRALLYLVDQVPRFCSIQEIAYHKGLPQYFLSRVLRTLACEGILKSRKGPGGGFQLTRPPEEITLYEIKKAIDGAESLEGLLPCALDERGLTLCAELRQFLQSTTLADLLACQRGDNQGKEGVDQGSGR